MGSNPPGGSGFGRKSSFMSTEIVVESIQLVFFESSLVTLCHPENDHSCKAMIVGLSLAILIHATSSILVKACQSSSTKCSGNNYGGVECCSIGVLIEHCNLYDYSVSIFQEAFCFRV